MLFGPPPGGANTGAMTRQNMGVMTPPQAPDMNNYYASMYRSSYAPASSYAVPSSIDAPNPYYNQPLQQNPNMQMARALARGR